MTKIDGSGDEKSFTFHCLEYIDLTIEASFRYWSDFSLSQQPSPPPFMKEMITEES